MLGLTLRRVHARLRIVNPAYEAREVAFQLIDSGAQYILTRSGPQLARVQEAMREHHGKLSHVRTVFLADDAAESGTVPFSQLLRHSSPAPDVAQVPVDVRRDVAAMPYSSGTTGLPKGVCLSHFNLTANILQCRAIERGLSSSDVFIGVLPFFHIYGFTMNAVGLHVGVTNVTMPKFDLEAFLRIVQEYRATYLHVVPPMCILLAKHPLVDKFNLSSVRMFFSGAAPLSAELAAEVHQRFKPALVKQAYGMTELSPGSHITPTEKIKGGSCGILLPHTEARILDLHTGKVRLQWGPAARPPAAGVADGHGAGDRGRHELGVDRDRSWVSIRRASCACAVRR